MGAKLSTTRVSHLITSSPKLRVHAHYTNTSWSNYSRSCSNKEWSPVSHTGRQAQERLILWQVWHMMFAGICLSWNQMKSIASMWDSLRFMLEKLLICSITKMNWESWRTVKERYKWRGWRRKRCRVWSRWKGWLSMDIRRERRFRRVRMIHRVGHMLYFK